EVDPDAAAPVLQFEPVSHAPLLVAVQVAFAASAKPGTAAQTLIPSSGMHERSARAARKSSDSPTISPWRAVATPVQLLVCRIGGHLPVSVGDATKNVFGRDMRPKPARGCEHANCHRSAPNCPKKRYGRIRLGAARAVTGRDVGQKRLQMGRQRR